MCASYFSECAVTDKRRKTLWTTPALVPSLFFFCQRMNNERRKRTEKKNCQPTLLLLFQRRRHPGNKSISVYISTLVSLCIGSVAYEDVVYTTVEEWRGKKRRKRNSWNGGTRWGWIGSAGFIIVAMWETKNISKKSQYIKNMGNVFSRTTAGNLNLGEKKKRKGRIFWFYYFYFKCQFYKHVEKRKGGDVLANASFITDAEMPGRCFDWIGAVRYYEWNLYLFSYCF